VSDDDVTTAPGLSRVVRNREPRSKGVDPMPVLSEALYSLFVHFFQTIRTPVFTLFVTLPPGNYRRSDS